MIRRRRPAPAGGLERLVADTQELVSQLLRENRTLRARNQRLTAELARLSQGWEQIRKLARSAPRPRRRTGA